MKTNETMLSFRCTKQLAKDLDRVSSRHDINRSEFIRAILEHAIEIDQRRHLKKSDKNR